MRELYLIELFSKVKILKSYYFSKAITYQKLILIKSYISYEK